MINKNEYCIINLVFLCLCLENYFTFGEKYEALGKDSAMGDAMAMRSLLENNLGMIIAFDGQGTVTFLNGIAREELDYRQGKKKISVEDIFPTLIRENCNYDEYVNSVQGQLIKTVAYRKNNTCFPVMIRFSKLFFEDVGQINAVAGLNIQDEEDAIRELKKVEQEMEQNLKARDSFVANITHELRTPVNGIKGHVKNLLDLETEPSKKSTLGIIIQCCNNMEKIINNLLDFSKMEAGKFEICEKPFEFKSCVNQAMDTNRPVANQKGLHFHAFVAEDVPQTVIGDELRITQIMNNLLSNAFKFTKEEGEAFLQVKEMWRFIKHISVKMLLN